MASVNEQKELTPDVPETVGKKKKLKKPRKKKKIIFWIIIGVLLLSMVACAVLSPKGTAGPSVVYSDTTILSHGAFSNTISATGTVESANSTLVYSTLSYAVESVYVEVGDTVEEGELLAELDEKSILNQIESQQASLNDSSANSAQSIKSAQDNYNQYKYSLDNGLNSTILSAQTQVNNAQISYDAAVTTYNRYKQAIEDGQNSTLLSQENALNSSKSAMDSAALAYEQAKSSQSNASSAYATAQNAYDNTLSSVSSLQSQLNAAQALLDAALPTDPGYAALQANVTALKTQYLSAESAQISAEMSLTSARSAYDTAVGQVTSAKNSLDTATDAYNIAKVQYTASQTSVEQALADYSTAVENADLAYQDAVKNLDVANVSAENQLQSYANALNSARVAANSSTVQVSLRQLQVDLDSTSITAPTSGTITAVYAKVGSSGAGLLFVIEDVSDLIVNTSIKEYDIGSVALNTPASVKSDATGDASFDGVVDFIAPTIKKNAAGETDTSANSEFRAEVKVSAKNTPLRIGMSVRLKYIIEEQNSVICVPYDAVYTNAAGDSCVLVIDEGTNVLRELPVTPGSANDLDIIISGDGVSDGLRVVNQPDSYIAYIGSPVTLTDVSSTAGFAAMMMAN